MRRATSGEDQSTAQISAVNPTQEVKIVRASVSFFITANRNNFKGTWHPSDAGSRLDESATTPVPTANERA